MLPHIDPLVYPGQALCLRPVPQGRGSAAARSARWCSARRHPDPGRDGAGPPRHPPAAPTPKANWTTWSRSPNGSRTGHPTRRACESSPAQPTAPLHRTVRASRL